MLRIGAFRVVQVMFLYEDDVVFGSRDGPKEVEKSVIRFEAMSVDRIQLEASACGVTAAP